MTEPDIIRLVKLLDKLEEAIQRPWDLPPFLLAKERTLYEGTPG